MKIGRQGNAHIRPQEHVLNLKITTAKAPLKLDAGNEI